MAGSDFWRLSLAMAVVLSAAACSGAPRPRVATASSAPASATQPVRASSEAQAPPAAPAPATAPPPGSLATSAPAADEPGARELVPEEEADLEGAEEEPPARATDPEHLLHEALEGYEASRGLWDRGAIDEAFATLDHAYTLMASVPANGDAALAQEKENLRQLISRRIVEIYASRRRAVGDTDRSIPRVVNADVEREIASFQGPERDFFLEAYRRSGLYRPMIVQQLQAAGLPEALSWLPLVESGFKERALSSARALGLWQFIASTGYRYGLERSDWIDERMDPARSTAAAIGYLTDLHNLLGDWLTALAAYNCGEGNVLRQIGNQKESYFDQFWDLYARLPQETRRYVPRFLATLAILEDPAKYGFTLPETLPPVAFDTVEVARATKLEALDAALGLESGTLARLNPELRRNASPAATYPLKVPVGTGARVAATIAALPEYKPPKVEVTSHRVRSGETLSEIASRYHTSVAAIMSLNHLRSANRLSIGQRLQVPSRGGSSARSGGGASGPRASVPAGQKIEHTVEPGDNLWALASRYGTTVERIRSDNGLASDDLFPGQHLTIVAGGS
jgi:membrane-bound lytic murein transglycosylase D